MEPGIELMVRVLMGAAIRPSVGAPPITCCRQSPGYQISADDLVEGLGLAGLALEGSFASVLGGAPAAAVVFTADVDSSTANDPRIPELVAG
jgi:hypothetical protein